MRRSLVAVAALLAVGSAYAQPLASDSTQLPLLRGHYQTVNAQYVELRARCGFLLAEVLAYVGPVGAPMQPRDEACAQYSGTDARILLGTQWRACSANHFAAYDTKRAEFRACHEEENRLGRIRLDQYRQIVALDARLRQAALASIARQPAGPGWLGVEIEDLDPQRAAQLQLGGTLGAYVERTRNRSPARKAGILEGDLITGFDGAPVRTSSDLLNYAQGLVAGQTVVLDVLRDGVQRTIYVAIEARR